jgi:hypothetical protein
MFCADGKCVESELVRRLDPRRNADVSEAFDEDPVAMYIPRSRPV